jgi:hypothetical protein
MSEYLEKLRSLQFGPKGDSGRGSTVQLPKNYPYAKKRTKDGKVCWTTKQEARDIASRAQDNGEGVWFDA